MGEVFELGPRVIISCRLGAHGGGDDGRHVMKSDGFFNFGVELDG